MICTKNKPFKQTSNSNIQFVLNEGGKAALSATETRWPHLFLQGCKIWSLMSAFVHEDDCLCVYTYVRIHVCCCQLQGTSGWNYIIIGPGGALNLDIAGGSCPWQRECQLVGVRPLLKLNPAARTPSKARKQRRAASHLSLTSSLLFSHIRIVVVHQTKQHLSTHFTC